MVNGKYLIRKLSYVLVIAFRKRLVKELDVLIFLSLSLNAIFFYNVFRNFELEA